MSSATSAPSNTRLIAEQIMADFNQYSFESGEVFMWSPEHNTVFYEANELDNEGGLWSLIHEIGHAECGHKRYHDDLQLVMFETQAWAKAKELAATYDIEIGAEHIDDCIESYRSWMHERSRCIDCKTVSFQPTLTEYHCHNCNTRWNVSASRACDIRKTRIKHKPHILAQEQISISGAA